MGVMLDPAVKDEQGCWHHHSAPVSPGWTYSSWKRILDALCLGEAHVTVGRMPIVMLERHLDRFGLNIQEGYEQELRALIFYCQENGYSHIGWA